MHRLVLFVALTLMATVSALVCNPMCQHGTCVANHGNKSCQCDLNWFGDNCSQFICDVDTALCGNGTCAINPKNQSQFLCACPTGYTGNRCQYVIPGGAICQTANCSGGMCVVSASNQSAVVCINCPVGQYGSQCQYSVLSTGPDPCVLNNYCNGRGVCSYVDNNGRIVAECDCSSDYNSGSASCLTPRFNYCFDQRCTNGGGGRCDLGASIKAQTTVCVCTANYTGPNCTVPFNVCDGRCLNGGTCRPTNGYQYFACTCPPFFTGERCEISVDPCVGVTCANGGTCIKNATSPPLWTCSCPRGFGGTDCTANTQCNDNPCQHGGICIATASGGYFCNCTFGYTGPICNSVADMCLTQPCEHGGTCRSDGEGEFSCACPSGYTGETCDLRDRCVGVNCVAGSTCVSLDDSYACVCSRAVGNASVCGVPNYCVGNPCGTGMCLSNYSGYTCLCADGLLRASCDGVGPAAQPCGLCGNGGTCANRSGVVSCVCPSGFTGQYCESTVSQCSSSCISRVNNSICDMECFTSECNYGDEADCRITPTHRNPWTNCNSSYQCPLKFKNGQCDVLCNTGACLYDGYDCIPANTAPSCPEALQKKCFQVNNDGVCQPECYTAICPYDQKDCKVKSTSSLVNGSLVMIIFGSQPFKSTSKLQFLSDMANIIRSQPFTVSEDIITIDQLAKAGYLVNLLPFNNTYNNMYTIYNLTLQLDNRFCESMCPASAAEAASTLQAYYATGHTTIAGYSVIDSFSVDAFTSPTPSPGSTNVEAIGGSVVGVVVVIAIVFVVVLVLGKRDRIRAKLWRPQSPGEGGDHTSPSRDRLRSTTGTITSVNGRAESEEFALKPTKLARVDTEHSITLSTVTVTTKMGEESTTLEASESRGERKWSCLHYEALRNPKLVQELVTKHRHHSSKSPDINAKGPGGYTPLMLSVMSKHIDQGAPGGGSSSRSNSESSGDSDSSILRNVLYKKSLAESHSGNSSEASGGVVGGGVLYSMDPVDCSVDVLLGISGIDVNSCNDGGQTALHLAAACSRGDYVQQLIKAGANPNVQDKEGHTPLQVAIAACAEGTFTILINHPSTDINLPSEGLITPLMQAVKHLNLLMVKSLLRRNAEITAVDSEGRTAIHWAAVINNVDALKLLMRQGPETLKDAQDNKGQTALFLACREGAVDCVRHLLDCFANTTLLDNLDRSPLQIAKDRLHHDIMEMLKQATHGPYSQFSVMHAQKGYQPYVQELHFPPHRNHQMVAPPPSTTMAVHMDTGDLHRHLAGDPREQNPYMRPRGGVVASGYQDCRIGVHAQLGAPFVNGGQVHPSPTYREDIPARKVLTKVKSSVSAYNPWNNFQQLGLEAQQQQQSPSTTTSTTTSMAPPPQSLAVDSYRMPMGVDTCVDGLDLDAIADLLHPTTDELQAPYVGTLPNMTNTKPLQHLPYDPTLDYSPPQGSCSNSSPSYPSPPNSNRLVPSVTGGHSDTPSPESQDSKKSSPYMETHYIIEPVYHGDCRLGNLHNQFPYQLPAHAAESAV